MTPRSAGQRRHDGFATGLLLLLSSGTLPTTAGCVTTVVLRCDAETFATSHARHSSGSMVTGHGYSIPAGIAKTWLDPEARAIAVLLSDAKGIEAYSSTQRLFTEQQRLAMIARDGGCTYWGCDSPPAWTQAHHVTDHHITGHTRVDDGALACGRNHRSFASMGFTSTMIRGRPHWTPPKTLDPQQTPRRNHLHDRS